MEPTIGLVIYNSLLKGYLEKDKWFSSNLKHVLVFDNEAQCKTEMEKLSRLYKEVEAYKLENMEVKKLSLQIID